MRGEQQPRVSYIPDTAVSYEAGVEAIECAALAGLNLDPWQQGVIKKGLAERADGNWAAMEVGLVVSRQNGKGAILEARELAGLFVLKEPFIIHSAHQFDTSLEAFRRLLFLIESTPDFDRLVKRVSKSHGEEGIELLDGPRIRFRTRTKGGGRGFSAPCVIFDEAMELPEPFVSAAFPITSAQPNPQVWYTGSAVDQFIHDNGTVFARIRARGHAGTDKSLAYFEWSVDEEVPEKVDMETALSECAWAAANPALGIRISSDYVGKELLALGARGFAVERLGVGDWPSTDEDAGVFDMETWKSSADSESLLESRPRFAFDVSPTRAAASICVAGSREDGLGHVELVDRQRGTGWLVERLAGLQEKYQPESITCDELGPAASLIPALEKRGVIVETTNTSEMVKACGMFFDAVDQGLVRHLGQPELTAAVKGATKRPLGDRFAWDRKNSTVDITPLVGCTLAYWAAFSTAEREVMVAWV